MHYAAEFLIPPTGAIKAVIDAAMKSLTDDDSHCGWWDWYVIGGRFSGDKLVAGLDTDPFFKRLNEMKITVSAVCAGKEAIMPASQIPAVDALWRQMFPGRGNVCPLFDHYRTQKNEEGINLTDVCTVGAMPKDLAAARLLAVDSEGAVRRMLASELWNGKETQNTDWNGNVAKGLKRFGKAGWYKFEFTDDWRLVTVDYHN